LRHSTGANKGDFRDLRVADPLSRFDSDDYSTWNQAMTTPAWSLHPQLEKDTISVGDLPLSRVFVIKDANYPWLLLVPRRVGATEILDLDEVEQVQLMTEMARVSRALKAVTRCDVVPQLHVHIIARRTTDAAWPKPVWGQVEAITHDPLEVEAFIRELRRRIWVASE
jgi:diadenosine tetraphosphate (Ap4A) HIT family hydrolase